jgi:hypothetical protein
MFESLVKDLKHWAKEFVKLLNDIPNALAADISYIYVRKITNHVNTFYASVQNWLDDYYLSFGQIPPDARIVNELYPDLVKIQDILLKELANNSEKLYQLPSELREDIEALLKMDEKTLVALFKDLIDD